jgi:oligopeptidase B
MFAKKNTFLDFIACGEQLIQRGLSKKNELYAMGGSAGGLLMGVIANLRPTLFKGIVNQVGFVDVVTTMMDETIPLTTGEYDEWGNPNNEDSYHYILSYSPYDNIDQLPYPEILLTTGFHDSQVQYWEPAKYLYKLRMNSISEHKAYLHTNFDAGHGGSSGRFEYLKEIALEYAFLLRLSHITQ